jgi:chemotaxis protein methyltransferase CheR
VTALFSFLSDPDFGRLKEHLIRSTGLAYYADKDQELAERIGRRLAALDIRNCGSYLDTLHDPARGEAELDALAIELTIGETYFFRHGEQFDALRSTVLPDIIERNRPARRLRIWSAGCATGAEPYSVALLLRNDLAEQIAGWDVTILGTDVNRSFLACAREGRFEEWAFRSTPNDIRDRCFERQGKSWLIRPEYKEWVSFQYHNLAKHPFPSLVNNLSAFDLILCRNVMIYFARPVIGSIVGQFWECLVEGGWLLVGHAELHTETFRAFRTVNAGNTTLYQKAAALPAEIKPEIPQPRLPDLPLAPLPARAMPAGEQTPAPPGAPPPVEAGGLAQVRELADRGDWQSAAECCRRLLETDGLDPATHFYRALVLEHLGFVQEAELSLRGALYLDRGFVLAHYHLGLLLQNSKRAPQAVRCFENVLDLLSCKEDQWRLADCDGMTAADLREMAKMHLEILRNER